MSRQTSVRNKTRVATRTIVGVACLAAAAGAVAYGLMSLSVAVRRPITVARSASTPDWGMLLSTDSTEAAAYTITNHTAEDIWIDTMSFDNCLSLRDIDGDCADRGETSGNTSAVTSIYMSYIDRTGADKIRAGVSGTHMGFGGLDVYVPALSSVDVQLNIGLADFASAGIASGERIQFNFDGASAFGFTATGVTTSRVYTEADVNMTAMGLPIVLRYTEPHLSLSSISPSGRAIPGYNEAFRVVTAARSYGDVAWTGATFKVITTDNAGTDWNSCSNFGDISKWLLSNLSTGDDATTIQFFDSTGVSCAASANDLAYIYVRIPSPMGDIPAGMAYTYALYADTSLADEALDDSLQIEIPAQSSLRGGALSRLKAVEWSDGYATGLNGNYVDYLPVTGGTITY
ncbi:MAG: hypothetical protein NUV56_00265 [Candidatus Uhrbacteria bacterium]|nr:hypothetical protein [Candidatus Uhrbacteria bacterium]